MAPSRELELRDIVMRSTGYIEDEDSDASDDRNPLTSTSSDPVAEVERKPHMPHAQFKGP
jgi:hypothetical protein